MSNSPMTVRFTDEEAEFLRLLAAWWCAQGKTPTPNKSTALRKMLRMVKPPSDESPLGNELRKAYEAMLAADTSER